MDTILLNDDFIDFVTAQMQNSSYVLEKIEGYKQYSQKSFELDRTINEIIDPKIKMLIEKMLTNNGFIEAYENAFAFYLGMKQSFNMTELEKN